VQGFEFHSDHRLLKCELEIQINRYRPKDEKFPHNISTEEYGLEVEKRILKIKNEESKVNETETAIIQAIKEATITANKKNSHKIEDNCLTNSSPEIEHWKIFLLR